MAGLTFIDVEPRGEWIACGWYMCGLCGQRAMRNRDKIRDRGDGSAWVCLNGHDAQYRKIMWGRRWISH